MGSAAIDTLTLDKIGLQPERQKMSQNLNDPGHGDSVASWAAVIVIILAVTVGTFAFWFDLAPLVWASAVVAALGVPVGILLKRAGYGVGGAKSKKNH